MPVSQALALFIKAIRKLSSTLQTVQRAEVVASIPERDPASVVKKKSASGGTSDWRPMDKTVDEELAEAGGEVMDKMKALQREMIDSMDLSQ